MTGIGRMLVVAGVVLAFVGLMLIFGERLGIRIGRLPGDIVIRGKSGTFYFPVVTCILLSVIGSLVLWLVSRR